MSLLLLIIFGVGLCVIIGSIGEYCERISINRKIRKIDNEIARIERLIKKRNDLNSNKKVSK